MQAEEIKKLIEAGLHNADVTIEGDGTHFSAIIICDAFAGKSRVQRQQLVNETVKKQLLDGTLHALSMRTFTQAEWQVLDV